jgi:hypothetical protein
MTAAIRVDGTTYRLLGPLCTPNVSALPTTGLPKVYPTRTVYEFAGAGVEVNMTFASPAFLEDMHSLSLPLALVYFDVRVRSSESGGGGGSHTVELFFEASSQLIVDDDSSPVVWRRDAWASAPGQSAASLAIGTEAQDVLTQRDFYIDPGVDARACRPARAHFFRIPVAQPPFPGIKALARPPATFVV